MARRWRKRPVLAVILRLAIFVIPVGGAIAAARAVLEAVPAVGGPARAVRLALALIVSLLVVDLLERVMRRLLPLAGLLKLSMAFPERAPSRFRVARRAASLKDLDARLAEAKARGIADEPTRAAEEILALVSALSSHDRRTRGHSERVRVFTDLLATELGLNRSDRDRLRWAALLHDIGKLRVDPALLNKAGKPDRDEWEQLRAHPATGAAIIGPLRGWLGDWVHAVEHHHERFDGDGYPGGLAGDEVPYAGRIVGLTDAFETMTAARAYKRPMTATAARSELVRDAGTHFDPALVRAFLGISVWRLRWAMGPASWMAQLPLIGELPKVGPAVAKVGDAAVLGAKVTAASVTLAASGLALGPASARQDRPANGGGAVTASEGRSASGDAPADVADGNEPPDPDGPSRSPEAQPGRPDPSPVPSPGLLPSDPLPSDPFDPPPADPLDPLDPLEPIPTDPLPSDPLPSDPLPSDPLDPLPVNPVPTLPPSALPSLPSNPLPSNPLPNEPLPNGTTQPALGPLQHGTLGEGGPGGVGPSETQGP